MTRRKTSFASGSGSNDSDSIALKVLKDSSSDTDDSDSQKSGTFLVNSKDTRQDKVLQQIRKGSAMEVTPLNLSNFMKIKVAVVTPQTRNLRKQSSVPPAAAVHKTDSSLSLLGVAGKRCQKLSLISNEGNSYVEDLAEAIRSGNVEVVNQFLRDHPRDCLNQNLTFEIFLRKFDPRRRSVRRQVSRETQDDLDGTQEIEKMTVKPLHVAIISCQSQIVRVFLEFAFQEFGVKKILEMLRDKTSVAFSDKIDVYFYDDIALDGMNSFHLSSKYDPRSLHEILDFLGKHSLLCVDLINETDNQMQMTPLHIAVNSFSSLPTEWLISCGAKINVKDRRGYTPLHIAAKSGNEAIVTLLLDSDANCDAISNDETLNKTPLHRASTGKTVQILLRYGANRYARMKLGDEDKGKKCDHEGKSVFKTLLQRNPGAAEEILNAGISKNYQDMDSPELIIVYDFELFFKEHPSCFCRPDSDARLDEMTALNCVVRYRMRDLLKHPLMESFLHLKWQLTKKFFILNCLFYAIFLSCITALTGVQSAMLKCGENTSVLCAIDTSALECTDGMVYNTTNFDSILHNCRHQPVWWAYNVLYIFTFVGTILLGIREGLQALFSWKQYSESKENILEVVIIFSSLAYLITVNANLAIARHLAAWCVFLAWLEMTMLLGRIPSIGIYIYMSIYVIKTLLLFIGVYFPVLAAFAFAFFILLPHKPVFDNPLKAGLKVLVMMIGEFDLEEYFIFDSVKNEAAYITTQILFVLFLIFVSIVVANLVLINITSKSQLCAVMLDLVELPQLEP